MKFGAFVEFVEIVGIVLYISHFTEESHQSR